MDRIHLVLSAVNGDRREKQVSSVTLPAENGLLGILANQPAGCRERLHLWGIEQYFDLILASAEEGLSKPDPAFFMLALQRAGCLPHQAVMVGDRLDNDILPAKKIGFKTVWVKQGFAQYRQVPDFSVETLAGLLDFIK